MSETIGTEMAIILCIGTVLCIVMMIALYAALGGDETKLNIGYGKKHNCLHCDDGSCVHCTKRVARLIARRDLLSHKRDCHYRETLGGGPCTCKEEV